MIKSIDLFLVLLALIIFLWGINKRTKLWGIGLKEDRSGQMGTRIKYLLIEGIAHKRILRDLYPGLLHFFLFIGFMIPLGIVLIAQFKFTLPIVLAQPLSLLLDLIALAAVLSLSMITYRRFITRPSRLDNRTEDSIILMLLFFILLTGLFLEGLRLSVIGTDSSSWAPVGRGIAVFIDMIGLNSSAKSFLAMLTFRIHFFLVLSFIASIPYSKLFHIISSPLNILFRSLEPRGNLSHMDLEDEDAESFGVSKIEEFNQKQLIDLDACIQCGRCEDHCPAHLTEKPLSPKKLINDLKDHLHSRGPVILKSRKQKTVPEEIPPFIGNTIQEDELWTCTTCRSCMEQCPVCIELVDKVVDMRRYQVLMESKFPEELTAAFKGLERNSNPWGLGADTRSEWIKELNVPVLSEIDNQDIEFLFFVGCIRSFDDRNKNVAAAMTKILDRLGSRYAILGMEEGCCGDPARRVGNEYLYQILAQTNIETFNKYKIKKILTTCPHCFNTLENEYKQLGFQAEVIHHVSFLQDHIQKGNLKLHNTSVKKLTYHDPCYLGRYSEIYDPPREIIKALPSCSLTEMERSRSRSFCCGAGGGWMWMDEKIGKRINHARLEDALNTDSDGIATACPFCVTMFHDAIKDKGLQDKVQIWDIAELVEKALSD